MQDWTWALTPHVSPPSPTKDVGSPTEMSIGDKIYLHSPMSAIMVELVKQPLCSLLCPATCIHPAYGTVNSFSPLSSSAGTGRGI